MPSWRSTPAKPATGPTPASPPTCTTRSNSSWPLARGGTASRRLTLRSISTATPCVWQLPPANLHHEIELVVAIGKGGYRIPAADAPQHIYGYAVGLDMTRRDLQNDMK